MSKHVDSKEENIQRRRGRRYWRKGAQTRAGSEQYNMGMTSVRKADMPDVKRDWGG